MNRQSRQPPPKSVKRAGSQAKMRQSLQQSKDKKPDAPRKKVKKRESVDLREYPEQISKDRPLAYGGMA